ncbi:ester cyclase [Nannocystis pusilla]|uniref:ester cyclase n=1 Tax=Nannocystis pusilla TaxID=889268 RepID=UPI003B789277
MEYCYACSSSPRPAGCRPSPSCCACRPAARGCDVRDRGGGRQQGGGVALVRRGLERGAGPRLARADRGGVRQHEQRDRRARGHGRGAAFLRKTFEKPRFVVEDAMAEGDRVAVRWKLFGRHVEPFRGAQPSGEAVVVPAMSMYRMAGGKIAESWVQSGPPQPHGGS